MGSREIVCPVCGQPVDAVVRRHKTLGVVVPVWRPGPCRNPRCSAHQDQKAEQPASTPGIGTGTEQGSQSGEPGEVDPGTSAAVPKKS